MSHPDIRLAVRAMRAGAVDVLTTPIDNGALIGALEEAIERSRAVLDAHASLSTLRQDYASLSKREREVMALIVSGLMNKQAGWELGISEITVKAHRGQVMRKMRARSFADLVNKAARLAQASH
jgi:FixJ family two-component response regulator